MSTRRMRRKRNVPSGSGSKSRRTDDGEMEIVERVEYPIHEKGRRWSYARLIPRSLIGKETKYVDAYRDLTALHELSDTADDTWADCEVNPRNVSGAVGCLPVPQVGSGYYNREGRKIFLKKIHIKGSLKFTPTSESAEVVTASVARIVIFQDTKTNGAEASAENVIGAGVGGDDNACTSGDGNAINLPTNPNGWGRYKIRYDKTFRIPFPPIAQYAVSKFASSSIIIPFKHTVNCYCEVNFKASTGTVADVIDNSFQMAAACYSTNTAVQLFYYSRTTFVG